MYCQHCGAEINDSSKFCIACGTSFSWSPEIDDGDEAVFDIFARAEEGEKKHYVLYALIAIFAAGLIALFSWQSFLRTTAMADAADATMVEISAEVDSAS